MRIIFLVIIFALLALPALADKGKGNNNVFFVDDDDVVVYTGRKCPPGLAKKNNACMPPGQYKKLVVGERLPDGISVSRVSRDILRRLDPAPWGHRYVRVDDDIVLIDNRTNEIDAIIALMNLAR